MTTTQYPLRVGTDDGTTTGNLIAPVITVKYATLSMATSAVTTAGVITPIASAAMYIPDGAHLTRATYRRTDLTTIASGAAAVAVVKLGTAADASRFGQVSVSAAQIIYAIPMSGAAAISANGPLVWTMLVATTAGVSAWSSKVQGVAYMEYFKE